MRRRRTAPGSPTPEPNGPELLMRTLTHRTLNPSEQLRTVRAAARAPRESLAQAEEILRGMASSARILRPLGGSSLVGPVGPHRTWSWAHVRLSDVKAVRAVARRDGQRRGAGDRLGRVARSARGARGERRRPHGPRARARLGAPAGRARRLQQPRVGDVRRAARGDRRPGRAPRVAARADGRPQAVQAGGGGRRAHLALGLRAADAAGDGRPARRAVAVAGRCRPGSPTSQGRSSLSTRSGAGCSSPSRSSR